MRKKLICFVLTVALLIGLLPPISLYVRASTYSGTCGGNLTWDLDGSTGVLRISGTGTMNGYSQTGTPWYSYRSAIKSVVLPYGITSIGKCAFSNCSGITEIELPETLRTIEAAAFIGTSISKIAIPKGVTKMYSTTGLAGLTKTSALYGASMLRTVIFENGIQTIPTRAVQDCSQVKTIVFPESVTTIGDYTCSGCTGLKEIVLPTKLKTIGENAFNGCTGITKIDLPESLVSIGECAFRGCSGITDIKLPKALRTIEGGAFLGTSISTITIPQSITTMYSGTGLAGLDKTSALYGASMLRTVIFEKGLQTIPKMALLNCSQVLSAIVLNPNCVITDSSDTLGISGTTVIYGYAGSSAQSYARKYNYAFVDIEGSDKISSSTQRPITEFEWVMYASDRETKEGIGGVTATFKSGDKISTLTSDTEGVIAGTANMNNAVIQLSKAGYRNIVFYDGVLSASTRAVSMEKGNANDFYIASARLTVPTGGEKDIRNEQVVVNLNEAKMYADSVHDLTAFVNTNGKKVAVVYLKQGDNAFPGEVTEVEGFTKAHFKMPKIYGSLVPDQAVYLYAVATDGTVSEAYKLNFKLKDEKVSASNQETDMFRTDKDGNITGFKLGTDMTISIPENIPIIGGGKFGMTGLDWCPVKIEENEDGTKIIGIGIANLDQDEDTGEITNQFGDLEKWIEDFEDSKKSYDKANKAIENMKWKAKVRQTKLKDMSTEFTLTDKIKPKMDMYGYLKLSAENKLIGGGIMFSAKLEYEYEHQVFVGYFPICLEVGVGFGASFDGTFYMWDDENVRASMEGKIEAELSGKFGAGVGIAKVFTVGVWGEPKFVWTVDFPDVKHVLKLKGGAGVELKILGSTMYKTDWLGATGAEIEIYNSEKANKSTDTRSIDQEGLFDHLDYKQTVYPTDRSYTQRTSPWLGGNSGKRDTNAGMITLQSSIYSDAEPILMTTDDGQTVLLWLADNTERDAVNRTMLVYSVYNRDNNSWSAPVPVCDDGCGDYYPTVSGNYVAWHKSAAKFTAESTLEDMARNSDIYLAEWNGSGFDPALSVTSNDVMDTIPALYAQADSATVVWVRNENNNIFGNDTSNSIVFATVENGVVSEETVITTGMNAITELSCGMIGEDFTIAYVTEGDNDLNTTADWELCLFSDNQVVAVTQNTVLDSHPVFYNIDGCNALYWYSDGNVVCCSQIGDLSPEIVLPAEKYSASDDFMVMSNGDRACMAWSVTGAQQAIWGSYYENGTWTEATELVSTEANVLYPTSVMLEDGSLMTAFNNTKDNYDENGAYVNSTADLCVTYTGRYAETELKTIFFDESELLTCGEVTVYADLSNTGTTPVKTVRALVTQADGTVILDEQISCDLPMQTTKTLTLTCADQGNLGKKDWTVQLFAEEETDMADNSTAITIGRANLEIDCATKSASSSYGQIIGEIKNLGAETATDIVVSLVALDGEVIDTMAVEDIAAGGITVVNFRLQHIPYAEGNKEFYLRVESAEDTDVGNNEDYVVLPYSLYTECRTHTWDSGLLTKEASCTEEGIMVFTCTACAEQKTEPTAIKHTYETITIMPTDESRGYDKHVCSICGNGYRDNYVSVVSECDDSLKIGSTTLLLESDLSLRFYVPESVLEGWEMPYIAFKKAIYDVDGNVIDYKLETVTDYAPATIGDGTQYRVYTFQGISSMEMGSAVVATLYARKGDIYYKGQTLDYSVLRYATNILSKTPDSRVKTLLVDLLNYGSEAQIYFGYNTANLVNDSLTEEQRAYGTQGAPKLNSCRQLIKHEGATVSFKTCSLVLEDKVTINYYLNLAAYDGELNDLEVRISYMDTTGDVRTVVIDGADLEHKLYSDGNYYYVANFDKLYATQMSTICTAEVFSKTSGQRISNTVVYSVESYAYSKQSDATLSALINAMMNYGNAAASYFRN